MIDLTEVIFCSKRRVLHFAKVLNLFSVLLGRFEGLRTKFLIDGLLQTDCCLRTVINRCPYPWLGRTDNWVLLKVGSARTLVLLRFLSALGYVFDG